MLMKRTALALALIVVILLTSTAGAAYYISVKSSSQKEDSLPTATPTPTASPSPLVTPSPTPFPTPSPAQAVFGPGPLGSFAITSPSGGEANSNPITLTINGEVIVGSNVNLTMSYSLDGQAQLPLPVETQPLVNLPDETITGSVTLPNLSVGTHSITVFGDLDVNSPNEPLGGHHLAQDTVSFTVQGS
jgi:hypothetical protein